MVNRKLAGQPSYSLRRFSPRFKPVSIETEKAAQLYQNLRGYLGIRGEAKAPGGYKGQWALFKPGEIAWWHEVRWMPKLREGWHRLTFRQFLELYRIKTF